MRSKVHPDATATGILDTVTGGIPFCNATKKGWRGIETLCNLADRLDYLLYLLVSLSGVRTK
jgi:hypothetical protein